MNAPEPAESMRVGCEARNLAQIEGDKPDLMEQERCKSVDFVQKRQSPSGTRLELLQKACGQGLLYGRPRA